MHKRLVRRVKNCNLEGQKPASSPSLMLWWSECASLHWT